MELNTKLKEKLKNLAFELTDNFCYGCYKIIEEDRCPECGTDDFMRHLEGVGVEFGTDWIIEHLIKENCTPVDAEEEFEQILDGCNEPVKVGCCEWDAGHVLKELDPVAFRCGISDMLADDEQYVEITGEYYHTYEIENMIEKLVE